MSLRLALLIVTRHSIKEAAIVLYDIATLEACDEPFFICCVG